jgi:hypothetical protein
MVPNLKQGRSFRGAMLYYLHDKPGEGELLRFSDERLAWTATRNCAADAPELAFDEMIATARDAQHLKAEAGERLSGRPLEEPVMTISLSWHPSEKPGRDHIEKTADDYLRFMGWDEHQAVYLAHNDTEHPHVHIVLNRVHSRTGKVLDDAFSKNRSQMWAAAYERTQGRIWCQERVGKDYTRADDRPPHGLPHREAIEARNEARHYAALEAAAMTLDVREQDLLSRRHQEQREAFFETRHQQFKEARQTAYRQVRQEFRQRWVEHFRQADAIRQDAERKGAELETQILQLAREEDFAAAWQMYPDRAALLGAAEKQIAEARQALRDEQRAATRERQDAACKEVFDERALAYVQIKQHQKEERAEFKQLQAARGAQRPYDRDRLTDLIEERAPAPAHEAKSRAEGEHAPRTNDAERRADHDLVAEAARDAPDVCEQLELPRGEPSKEPAREFPDRSVERPPRRDMADGLAGAIAKAAEVIGKVLEAFLSPETPREKASREALARVIAETAPEREAEAELREQQQRQAAYEAQKSAQEKFDEYFARHGARLRREEEERQRNTKDRDR